MGVAGDDDDGGVGEVDADQQLDGRPQAVRARPGVGENPEKPELQQNLILFAINNLIMKMILICHHLGRESRQ